MALLRNRDSKKSATILRAVPESPARKTALHPEHRDLPTQSFLRTNDVVQSPRGTRSASSSPINSFRSRLSSSNLKKSASSKSRAVPDLNSARSSTSLKGAIGTYSHGRIQWRNKDRMPSANELFYGDGLDKSPRPKIQVVIPSESLDRPLPALPFFTDASNTVLYSNLHQLENAHDVSPPSATQRDVRDSVVSPLGQAQQQPMPFGQFQRSLSRRVATTTPHAAQVEQKRSFESSPSSNFSHDSDASSVNSESSSETSVETEVAPTNPKADSSSMRQRVPKSPVIASDPWITLGNVDRKSVV